MQRKQAFVSLLSMRGGRCTLLRCFDTSTVSCLSPYRLFHDSPENTGGKPENGAVEDETKMEGHKTASKPSSLAQEKPFYDWTGGSTYYFSEEEEMRLFPSKTKEEIEQRNRAGFFVVHSRATSPGAAPDEAESSPTAAANIVTVNGTSRSFHVDVSIPPVRREELERWRLEGFLLRKGYGASFHLAQIPRKVKTLLPLNAMVTYLGDDMHRIDKLFRQKGYFTPSEIAEVFIPLVPTFAVETRHVLARLSPDVMERAEMFTRGKKSLAYALFARYPMLFLHSGGRYQRPRVQLNSAFWFVRQHPGYGKADRALRRYRTPGILRGSYDGEDVEGETKVEPLYTARDDHEEAGTVPRRSADRSSRQPWSIRMLGVLLRYLPRVPTVRGLTSSKDNTLANGSASDTQPRYVKERYEPVNVLEWIGRFSPEDHAFVTGSHQLSILHLMSQYVHIFQLMSLKGGDHNLFVEGHVFLAGLSKAQGPTSTTSMAAENEELGTAACGEENCQEANDNEDGEDDTACWWTVQSGAAERSEARGMDDKAFSVLNSDALDAGDSHAMKDADALAIGDREKILRQAVSDELIDVDSILAEGGRKTAASDTSEERSSSSSALDGEGDAPNQKRMDEEGLYDISGDVDEQTPFFSGTGTHGRGTEDSKLFPLSATGTISRSRQHTPKPSPSPKGGHHWSKEVDEVLAFGVPLEEIYMRRLPPDVAPRSLSDLDEKTSPDPNLVHIAASFLASPPSLEPIHVDSVFRRSRKQCRAVLMPEEEIWRWVSVECLYAGLTSQQRRHLRRRYKGLVNFLRYHGKLFELSSDLQYVIAHDPAGTLAPIPHAQQVFRSAHRVVLPADFDDNPQRSALLVGEAERKKFVRALGEGHVPTTRYHLLLLDPDNPILRSEILHEAVAQQLPDHPIPLRDALARLPPVMRAALPTEPNFNAGKHVRTFQDRGKFMIAKASILQAHSTKDDPSRRPMSVEEAITELLQLPIGKEGVVLNVVAAKQISIEAYNTLCDHFGSLGRAVRMFPHFFELTLEGDARRKMTILRFRQ